MNFKFILIFIAISPMLWAESFRIITYNILSDEFLWPGMYDYVDKEVLSWENRRVKIVERIKKTHPDVVCLQELNASSFEYFKESLVDFEGFFAKKGGTSSGGVGTFCRKTVFKETRHKIVLCDGTSNGSSLSIQPALLTTLYFRNNKSITLINTKIRWNKNIKSENPTRNHMYCILKSIPKISAVVVGDFNMGPKDPLMQNFYSAGLHDVLSHQETYSCYANKEFKRIDYILSTGDLKNVPFETVPLSAPQPIPNKDEPSDHLPIGSVISFE